jgi:hypothetical protein
MRGERGSLLIEVLVAAVILLVGVLTALTAMAAAQKLTLVSERQTTMVQRAQFEVERLKSLPNNEVALTGTSSSWSSTSSAPTYVNVPGGSCPSGGGAAPTYQPDHSSGGSTATESLVINGCSYLVNGTTTPVTSGIVAPVTPWSDGNLSGNIYDFVTWANDPTCGQTSTPGSDCQTTNDYKRITVVVTLNGVTSPGPATVSAYLPNPNQSSNQNLLLNPDTSCLNSQNQTVSCSKTLSGTPAQYFLSDTPNSSGSPTAPSCSGNSLHNTVVNLLGLLGVAPVPDLLGTTLPTESCGTTGTTGATGTTGTATVPCYSLNLLSGCQGGLLQGLQMATNTPSGSNGCGSGPPSDNTKSHSWVTPGIPSGTTVNLKGTGALTAYLQNSSGVAVNVNLCLGLYVVPGGLLGSLLGNLLSQPIGVTVGATVSAQAGVPTPVSFNFNTGATAAVSGNLLGVARIEVVLWITASAGTNVSLAYDQAQVASQLTLMTS